MTPLKEGMTMAAVESLLGKPDSVEARPEGAKWGNTKWYYNRPKDSRAETLHVSKLYFSPDDMGYLIAWTEEGPNTQTWSQEDWNRLEIGVSPAQVVNALGQPTTRQVSVGGREHWIYKDGSYDRAELFFVSDKLDIARKYR